MPDCRTVKCGEPAVFHASLPEYRATAVFGARGSGKVKREPWEGAFCHLHLLAVLELKVAAIGFQTPMTIKRVA